MTSLRPAVTRLPSSLFRTTPRALLPLLPKTTRALSTTPVRPKDLQVGELPGGKVRIEPIRRVGEDDRTMRARLLCTSSHLVYTDHDYL